MQELCRNVKFLAGRSLGGGSDDLHIIYQMLVEAFFDSENVNVVDEIDEEMGLLKKTWIIPGINQMPHNLWFTWALFNHFAISDQVDLEPLQNLLGENTKGAKTTKDSDYCDMINLLTLRMKTCLKLT
jgi:hypothetical protein